MLKVPEHLDAVGAARLAARIMRFWHQAGHKNVRAWAEPVKIALPQKSGKETVRTIDAYQVRSNLLNGLPPAGSRMAMAA